MLTTAGDSARPFAARDFERLSAAASVDRFGVHALTASADDADLILFVGAAHNDFRDVRAHPHVRRFREKCFLFDASDRVIPYLPGVYACAEKRWFPRNRTRGGFFLRVFENDAIVHEPGIPDDAWLYSFVGNANNARVRRAIVAMKDERSLLVDTSREEVAQTDAASGANAERWSRYADVMRRSQFILCPRGIGTATWRLFEAMKAGRAPVILSDDWVAPDGPRWNDCSLRIAERDAARLPEILREHESRAVAMGQRAREEWEAWFSREVAFHRVVEWCVDIARTRRAPEGLLRFGAYAQMARPFFLRHHVLSR